MVERREDCRIWIGGLPDGLKDRDIEDEFRRFGKIQDVHLSPAALSRGAAVSKTCLSRKHVLVMVSIEHAIKRGPTPREPARPAFCVHPVRSPPPDLEFRTAAAQLSLAFQSTSSVFLVGESAHSSANFPGESQTLRHNSL